MAEKRVLSCVAILVLALHGFAQSRTERQPRIALTYQLSGRVVLGDGTPVPEIAEVILICSGAVRQRAFSQAGGQFVLTLGEAGAPDPELAEAANAPTGGGFRTFNQIGRGFGDDGRWASGRSTQGARLYLGDCELTASLAGFTSEVVYPGNRDFLQNPDLGSIRLHRRTQVRGTTVSLKSLAAPAKSRDAYERARKELGKKKPDPGKALKELLKAVAAYPEHASAWLSLGKTRLALGDAAGARDAFRKSAAADPDFLPPCLELADLHLRSAEAREAALWSAEVIEKNPHVILAYYLQAFARFRLGEVDVAEASIRKVQGSSMAAAYPATHLLLGTILARRGEAAPAAAEWTRYLELNPAYEKAAELRSQLEEWSRQGRIPAPGSP